LQEFQLHQNLFIKVGEIINLISLTTLLRAIITNVNSGFYLKFTRWSWACLRQSSNSGLHVLLRTRWCWWENRRIPKSF
jgi:hypothetical protein